MIGRDMMNNNRLNKIYENMQSYNIEQLIITSTDSIFYLIGKWIDPGERMLSLFIKKNQKPKLIINKLFPINDNIGVDIIYYDDTQNPVDYLLNLIDPANTMGIDKEWPSRFLIDLLNNTKDLKVINSSQIIDEVRMIKDKEEIQLMRESSKINDEVMREIFHIIKNNKHKESHIKSMLDNLYVKYGGDKCSFSPLICFGKNASEPHHSSDDTSLEKNNCIIVDIGGLYKGYCSDMTRSFFYGEPNDEYIKIYNLVKEANEKAIDMIKPGVKFSDIDKTARTIIEKAGYGEYFTHRTGHNIGISVHEYPDVSLSNDMTVKEGMIFSIEPGIYLSNKYGVRIEDLVLVTKDGCQVLNKYPKELTLIK